MTDRPIIFSAPMVLALLAGRKTQTRRLAWGKGDFAGGRFGIPAARWQRVQPGDRLWVQEDWRTAKCWNKSHPTKLPQRDPSAPIWYGADAAGQADAGMRRSSRFMMRWMSRLTLTVTDVRAQRLQEITNRDCYAEGIHPIGPEHHPEIPRNEFRDLWNHLHGPGAWEANPEVVALTFTVERRNIDATAPMEAAHGAA